MEAFKPYLLSLLFVIYLVISLATLIPGYLSIDEITYHLMAKNFSESGSFEIWNGYREYPSPELVPLHLAVAIRDGGLIPQPPYLINLLGARLYSIAGLRGLFFLNIIAFAGTLVLCYQIAYRLFYDRNLAIIASLILGLATFSYEYSQAIWFHATAAFAVTAAFYLFLCAFSANTPGAAWLSALASGLIAGLASGIRPDVIFVLPGLLFPFIFLKKPWRPELALTVCLGTIPGLLALSVTNDIKFEVFFPFSYGSPQFLEGTYALPFAGVILVFVLVFWGMTRYPEVLKSSLARYRLQAMLALVVCAIVLAMIPEVRQRALKHLHIAYQLIVDLRTHDLHVRQPAQLRTGNGGMVYIGGLKKSLLQSCPYLVGLIIPLLHIIRRHRDVVPLILLCLVPLTFTGFYVFSPNPATSEAWHGGLCLNLRYLLPILPFTSILTAYAWRELTRNIHRQWRESLSIIFFITASSYFFILSPMFDTLEDQEFLYLTFPLILALILGILVILREVNRITGEGQKMISQTTLVLLCVGMVWAGLVEFFYDYPLVRRTRKYNFEAATVAADLVDDDSLLFSTFVDPFFGMIERRQIRIANPLGDNFRDFPALAAFHLKQGRSVYAAFHPQEWKQLKTQNPFASDEFTIPWCESFSHGTLCQMRLKDR